MARLIIAVEDRESPLGAAFARLLQTLAPSRPIGHTCLTVSLMNSRQHAVGESRPLGIRELSRTLPGSQTRVEQDLRTQVVANSCVETLIQ